MATIQEAADYLNVNHGHVCNLIMKGDLLLRNCAIDDIELRDYKARLIEKSSAAMDEIVRLGQEMDCY